MMHDIDRASNMFAFHLIFILIKDYLFYAHCLIHDLIMWLLRLTSPAFYNYRFNFNLSS